jgi:hypothetical protein
MGSGTPGMQGMQGFLRGLRPRMRQGEDPFEYGLGVLRASQCILQSMSVRIAKEVSAYCRCHAALQACFVRGAGAARRDGRHARGVARNSRARQHAWSRPEISKDGSRW